MNTFWKQKTPRDKTYLEWIKRQPCCVCNSRLPSDPHHVPEDGNSAKGMKCSDYRALPMCHLHHQEYHLIGKKTFAIKYNIDYNSVITELNERYAEEERNVLAF